MMMSCVGFDVYKIFGAPPTPPSPTIFSEPPFWESFWILFQWSQIHKATLQWDLVEAGGLMLMFPVWVRLRYGTLVWRRHCDHFFIRPLFSGETPLSEGLLLSGLISRSQTRRYFRGGGGGGITIGPSFPPPQFSSAPRSAQGKKETSNKSAQYIYIYTASYHCMCIYARLWAHNVFWYIDGASLLLLRPVQSSSCKQ